MGWKTFLNFGSSDFRELAKRRIISLSEYKAVSKAYDFLLRVRNDMHYNFGRENDLLDLETQPKIAARLGFSDTLQAQGVEIFMRKIYYSFRVIDAVSKPPAREWDWSCQETFWRPCAIWVLESPAIGSLLSTDFQFTAGK